MFPLRLLLILLSLLGPSAARAETVECGDEEVGHVVQEVVQLRRAPLVEPPPRQRSARRRRRRMARRRGLARRGPARRPVRRRQRIVRRLLHAPADDPDPARR
jgi:hypothetical protein